MKKQFKSCRIKTSCCSFSEYLDQSVLIYRTSRQLLRRQKNKTKTLKNTGVDSEAGIVGKRPTFFFFFPFRGRRRSAPLLYLPLSTQPSKPVQIFCFSDFPSGESDLKENSRLKFRLAIRDNFLTLTGSLYLAV